MKFGVLIGPPNVSGAPYPASSMSTISTFGASSGAFGPGIIDQSATESRRVRPMVPPKVRSGMGSAARSWTNLPAASARADFSSSQPRAVHRGDRLRRCAAERPLRRQAVLAVDDRDDHRRARRELVTHGLLEAAVDLPLGELADDPADGTADDDRRQHRRRRETYQHAHTAAPTEALASEVVRRVGHLHLIVGVVLDEDHSLRADHPALDQPHQVVVVALRCFGRRVGGHDQIEGVGHRWTPDVGCPVARPERSPHILAGTPASGFTPSG